ncbi:sulfite exporter TauE/SafE family protein [Magnetococcus sp. PR-3]|uniref:sulfite exporter TauE/SafE family protein n=1 Tax=Magnetococcus sp. PR-3 TaxID=3120355 RepID=UPI002FCDF563
MFALFETLPAIHLLYISMAVLVAALLQGATGFGYALVAAPVVMLLQPELMPAPIVISALLLTLLMSARNLPHIQWRWLGIALISYLPGLWIGAWLLTSLPPSWVSLLFGGLTLLAVGLSWVGRYPSASHALLLPSGVVSGIMGVTTTMNGPPLVLALQHLTVAQLRGTMGGFFFMAAIPTLFTLHEIGQLERLPVQLGFWLMIPVSMGFLCALYLSHWFDQEKGKKVVLLLAGVSGVVIVLRSI